MHSDLLNSSGGVHCCATPHVLPPAVSCCCSSPLLATVELSAFSAAFVVEV